MTCLSVTSANRGHLAICECGSLMLQNDKGRMEEYRLIV